MIVSLCMNVDAQNTFYYDAYKHWSPQLEQEAIVSKNARMLASVGSCYDRGDGVSQDRNKAIVFFKDAASLNDMIGLYNLGYYYFKGFCVEKDNAVALKYLLKALEVNKDFRPAYLGIAQIYHDGGYGIDQNYSNAYKYFLEASNRKDVFATYELGMYHLNKMIPNANIDSAINYFEKCKTIDPKYLSAYIELSEIFRHGKGVEKDLDRAIANLDKEIALGFYEAYGAKASCYMDRGDFDNFAKNLQEGYIKGVKTVIHNLADCYYYGNGVAQSYKRAFDLFNEGSSSNPLCHYRIAVMYKEGVGVEKNQDKAIEHLSIASDKGVTQAQYLLGCEMYEGKNIVRNYEESVRLLSQALEGKYIPNEVKGDICRKLASCYRFGRGVEVDEKKADSYTNMSAIYGNEDAKKIQDWLRTNL